MVGWSEGAYFQGFKYGARPSQWLPHELNFRLHPNVQKFALESLYKEVGFARSLLASELPDGRLKLVNYRTTE
jgi:hypothetical protein